MWEEENALDHLETAYENGFSIFYGVSCIDWRWIKGTDDIEVPVRNGELVKLRK